MNYQADHDVPPSSDDLLLLGSSYRTFFRTQALRRSHCCDRISSILRKSLCDVECDVGCDRSGNQTEAASQIFQAQGTAMCHLLPLMIPLLQPFGPPTKNLLTFEAKERCDVE